MKIFMRPITALCMLLLLGLAAPAFAQKATLSTADPQVCCSGKDAAGNLIFFLAPKSQCPKNRVVALQRCKGTTSGPVCCKTPNGFFQAGSPNRCKAAGGSVVPNRYCKTRKPICCKLRNGQFSMVLPDRCKHAGGKPAPARYCKQAGRKVCCRTPNGFYSWTAAMCRQAKGTVVNAKYCRTRHICCKFTGANGNVVYDFLSPKVCKGYKGSQVSNHYCLRASGDLKLRRN